MNQEIRPNLSQPLLQGDAPWSDARQTVQMLELAAAQIHVAMRDSSLSVSTLMAAFTTLAERIQGMEARLHAQARHAGAAMAGEMEGQLHEAGLAMDDALVAMQFYDRLGQRLEHVEHSLGRLAGLLADPVQRQQVQAWHALQQEISARYTTEEERIMFSSVMSGMPVDAAVQHYKETVLARTGNEGQGEVELF